MKLMTAILATLLAGLCLSAPLWADDLMIYPIGGQSAEQQEKDRFECYGWAKNESGFDPMAPPTATEAPRFITVDLKNKELRLDRSGQPQSTQLRNREHLNGRLELQGVGTETGLGWTFSVDEETGRFVISSAGDEVAFIIFGACTNFPTS